MKGVTVKCLKHVALSHLIVAYFAFNLGQITARVGNECVPCVPCEPTAPVQFDQKKQTGLIAASVANTTIYPVSKAKKAMEMKNFKTTSLRSPFAAVNPTEHDILPGTFANNSLYLQSIRLTTSYEKPVDDLHVDLFGFPGDLTRVSRRIPDWQACQNVTDNLNETLWGRDEVKENVTLFCRLHGSGLIKMFFVPISSLDRHQDKCSPFLWRCNVTAILTKQQLLQHINNKPIMDDTASLLVQIWLQYRHQEQVTRIANFQIPLDSGAAGVGSPNIRGGMTKSYFHQPSVPIGLCVAVYGIDALKYLRQFVQHHLNVGFPSLFIGVRGPEDGSDLKVARQLLTQYIEKGVVTLAHFNGPFITEDDAAKLQFYLPCLYFYKGLAKYVATWDVDEFWLPPDVLNVDGSHNYPHHKLNGDFVQPNNEPREMQSLIMTNASRWHTFPLVIQEDPLWQASRYATSVSIVDTMNSIDRYYEEQGCASSFCYHTFPSHSVLMRSDNLVSNRTTRIGRVFEYRCSGYANIWQKSVVNTKNAHSLGFHLGGSCFSERFMGISQPSETIERQFNDLHSTNEFCYARRFDGKVYGSMHHFFELLEERSVNCGDSNSTQLDEYGLHFSPTVERQIERDDPNPVGIWALE